MRIIKSIPGQKLYYQESISEDGNVKPTCERGVINIYDEVSYQTIGGIGGASRRGILVKGGNYLEALAHAGIVVFDKTGTLTEGAFAVARVSPVGMAEEELLTLAALAEQWSDHPISRSVRDARSPDPAHQ